MVRLIQAELVKLRTTQVWFWLLLAAVAVSALIVVASLVPAHGVKNGNDVANMFAGASVGAVVIFVLGVLGVTTEFRYQTITPTLLQTPSRWTVVTAKMITYAIVGTVYAAVCLGVQLAMALPWLSLKHVHYSLGSNHIPRALVGTLVILALYGIIGLGVGALLKNQIVAVVVGVIFLEAIQNILLAIPGVKHAYPYMPGGASRAIVENSADTSLNGIHVLSVGGGVVVLLLWAFIPAVLGAAYSMNRDIT